MAIILENICKNFDNIQVFKNFNMIIKDGNTTCIMGKSGSGKTTLLRIIAGLTKIDSGRIIGMENKLISMVFQEDRLLPWYTSSKNIEIAISDKRNKTFITRELLTKLKLIDFADKNINDLSGGMQRRVSIARALAVEFDILLLDEPFKGLDYETKNITMNTIEEYSQKKTILFITHDIQETNFMNAEINVIN